MLKMIISCGGGMSSSALAVHMQKAIIERGLQDQVQVEFLVFQLLMNKKELSFPIQNKEVKIADFDIVLLCPHLMYYAKEEARRGTINIPMYIIPSLLYGKMDINELMEDAYDLLALYKDSDEMLMHFPEENLLDIKRNTSHRRWIQKHPIK